MDNALHSPAQSFTFRVRSYLSGDFWIWFSVAMLTLISIVSVFSSTGTLAYKYQEGNTFYYVLRHLFNIGMGLFAMYFFHKQNYKDYRRWANLGLFLAVFFLLWAIFFGPKLNEARRWVVIPGVGISFQASDLAKLALIVFIARYLSNNQDRIKTWKGFLPITGWVALIVGLIAYANMSTAVLILCTCLLFLFIGRSSLKIMCLVGLASIVVLSIVFALGPRHSTYISRLTSFSDDSGQITDKTFQSMQSKIAIAKGFPIGKGPGNSTQRNFLPHPYSDFIFSIIVEEYGFLGGLLVVFLYLLFLFRSVRIVTKAPRAFGALLAAGLSLSLVLQALANMMVSVGLMPVTGVTLPLISMGGTSILFTGMAVGIILSVSRDVEENPKRMMAEGTSEKILTD